MPPTAHFLRSRTSSPNIHALGQHDEEVKHKHRHKLGKLPSLFRSRRSEPNLMKLQRAESVEMGLHRLGEVASVGFPEVWKAASPCCTDDEHDDDISESSEGVVIEGEACQWARRRQKKEKDKKWEGLGRDSLHLQGLCQASALLTVGCPGLWISTDDNDEDKDEVCTDLTHACPENPDA